MNATAPARLGLAPVTRASPPGAVQELVAILSRIDGCALRLPPSGRRWWRAARHRLAAELVARGVRAA